MEILITGGAGFIGSHFADYMLRNYPNDRIVCLDKLTYAGNMHNLEGALENKNFTFVCGDIADEGAVEKLFCSRCFGMVINFAAESHVDRSIADAAPFIRTNVAGVQTLLSACVRHNVARFHHISTDEVYGDIPFDDEVTKFGENSPLRPSSPYAASKAAADLLVGAYCRTYGLFATLSRCANNYGGRQFPEKLIPVCISRALNNLPVPVYGSGRNVREWLDVYDHCRAIDLILQRGTAGQVYNVGSGECLSNNALVGDILGILGKSRSLIEYVPDRMGHDRRYCTDSSKLRALGWRPQVTLAQGLARTVRWYVENKRWLECVLSGEYLKNNAHYAATNSIK